MPSPSLVSLSTLLTEVRSLTNDPLPTYTSTWRMCVGGQLPAVQMKGRWFVDRDKLPAILIKLRLRPKAKSVGRVEKTFAAA